MVGVRFVPAHFAGPTPDGLAIEIVSDGACSAQKLAPEPCVQTAALQTTVKKQARSADVGSCASVATCALCSTKIDLEGCQLVAKQPEAAERTVEDGSKFLPMVLMVCSTSIKSEGGLHAVLPRIS